MNATIQEGNVGRNFGPVDKLKVALQNDGGDSFWVLEESVALENLYTHTNGTYLSSSDNVYGWGEVIVDVDTSIGMSESEIDTSPFVIDPDTGDLIDIDPYKETDYFITDPDTGDRIDVDPWQDEDEDWYIDDPFDPEGDPIPIQEDEDGDWYIEDPDTEEHISVEDEDNWYIDDPFDPEGDPIIVEEDENGDPFIEYDDEEVPVEDWDEDEWEDDEWEDDELDDDWDDEPDESWEDDDWDSDLDVDGISGIDPDTGLEVLIDVDENGNLIEAECPESIVIVTQPNKLKYLDGDSINLTGMVVTAKKADGSTWTSAKYPNGHIPLGELKFINQKADFTETTEYIDTLPIFLDGDPEPEEHESGFEFSGYRVEAQTIPHNQLVFYEISTGTVARIFQGIGAGSAYGFSLCWLSYTKLHVEMKAKSWSAYGNISLLASGKITHQQKIEFTWDTPCLDSIQTFFKVDVSEHSGGGGR